MEIERRAFMKCAAAAALTLVGPAIPRAVAADGAPRYLSACRLSDGGYAVAEFDPEGMIVLTIALPNRGHGFAVTADGRRAVAFSRHPYTIAVAFDVGGGNAPTVFTSPADRHFYGHGVFTSGDRLLLATENDFDNGRGVIGVYDVASGFNRIGEIDSSGVGPHELVMLADNRTAAIANGGIDTHPMTGDAKLNIPTMDPSLVFIDTDNGDIIAEHRLDQSLHQLSIRHLAVDAAGAVWFGCQYEGAESDQPPLIGRAGPDFAPRMLSEAPELRAALRNYIGSVAVTADGSVIAASSPRGGQIVFIDVAGNVLGSEALADGCGIAAIDNRRLMATSGAGDVTTIGPDAAIDRLTTADVSFDNHISRLRSA